MPATRLRNKGRETRRRLLEAAQTMLRRNEQQLELTKVARAAKLSSGAPYRYFESKAALLATLVERFYDRFDDAVLRPTFAEVGAWREREVFRTRRFVDFFYDDPLGAVVLRLRAGESRAAQTHWRRFQRAIAAASMNIIIGQQEGAIPSQIDPQFAGAAVIGGLWSALGHALTLRPRPPRKKVANSLCRFVSSALELAPAHPRPRRRVARPRPRG
jgi:AcrR family transcriptional regulator